MRSVSLAAGQGRPARLRPGQSRVQTGLRNVSGSERGWTAVSDGGGYPSRGGPVTPVETVTIVVLRSAGRRVGRGGERFKICCVFSFWQGVSRFIHGCRLGGGSDTISSVFSVF